MGILTNSTTLSSFDNTFLFSFIFAMSIWAKSISTGVVLVGIYINKKYSNLTLRRGISVIAILASLLSISTFFKNPDTFLNIYQIVQTPNFSSPITVGIYFLVINLVILTLMFIFAKSRAFNKLIILAFLTAIPTTIYSAFLLSFSNAVIHNLSIELIVFPITSIFCGSAILLLFIQKEEIKYLLSKMLLFSALFLFFIYLSFYMFADINSKEAFEVISKVRLGGEHFSKFWFSLTFAFIIPAFLTILSIINKASSLLPLASAFAISALLSLQYIYLVLL